MSEEKKQTVSSSPSEEQVIEQLTVAFQEDQLVVACTNSLSFYVSLASLCTALSLDTKGQIQRIKRSDSLMKGVCLLALKTRGGRQHTYCLKIEWLVEWLASIRLKSIHASQSEKIATYQIDLLPAIYESFYKEGLLQNQQWLQSYFNRTPLKLEEIESATSDDSHTQTQKKLTILSTLPPPRPDLTTYFTSTDYQVDRSMREAVFAQEEQWEMEADTPIFSASNHLQVYLGTPEAPLDLAEAQKKIRALGGSTALTARVVMGLWNLRRSDARLLINGSAAISIDEIFGWRGLRKHQRTAYPGTPGAHQRRRTDGYRPEQKQQILNDLALLASCCVRGHCTVIIKGKKKTFYINGSYLRYSIVTIKNIWGQNEVVGFFVSPGDWVNAFDHEENHLIEIDRRIFQLNPQNEQHELRIALYLVERWHQQTYEGLDDPSITMNDLLTASMIPIDRINIARFAHRIEEALANLWKRGIIQQPVLLTPIEREKARWGNEWLAAQWRILAPQKILDTYILPQKSELPKLEGGSLPSSDNDQGEGD